MTTVVNLIARTKINGLKKLFNSTSSGLTAYKIIKMCIVYVIHVILITA